jgi:hypothetical protein
MIDFQLGSIDKAEPVSRNYFQPVKVGFLIESPNYIP